MKKSILIISCILIIISSSLVGCGKPDPIEGTWKMTEMSSSGMTISDKTYAASTGSKIPKITIKGKKVYFDGSTMFNGVSSWQKDKDEQYIFKDKDNEQLNVVLNGDYLILRLENSNSELSMKFKRVEEK